MDNYFLPIPSPFDVGVDLNIPFEVGVDLNMDSG
jgi:hypothetical protein